MSELDLYKFVHTEHNIEYHWSNGDVILFIPHYLTGLFMKLLGSKIFEEDGIGCVAKDGYFCFLMLEICDNFGIEIKNVFGKEESRNG